MEDCPECQRLSEVLSEATQDHFGILQKLQLARNDNDLAGVAEQEALRAPAELRRGKARRELRRHEAIHAELGVENRETSKDRT